jgi:ABC-2 type transport system ATP-binding protein
MMIEVQGLVKKFGDKTVLNGVSFSVKEGEVFGYLGPNGAGKTTTLRIILGLIQPTDGHALVWDKNLGDNDNLRGKVGVLLEQDGLYERITAYQNLDYYSRLYGVEKRQQRINRMLDFVGLSESSKEMAGNLSRGMKRKLGLARAIIHDPQVLFLDEPSSGLDPEAQKMVRDLILRLSKDKGITIFLNSHDLDEVQRTCSSVAILQAGQLKAYDTIENLRHRSTKQAVEIIFYDNEEAEKAHMLLNNIDYINNCKQEGNRITAVLGGNQGASVLLSLLAQRGIKIEEFKKLTRSLEDIYLEVVKNEPKHE